MHGVRETSDDQDAAPAERRVGASLLLFVVGYNLAHHNGLIGSASAGGGTRLADWIDLFTPLVVVLPLLGFLWFQAAGARQWVMAAVGSIVYVEGHGIHLSANSISNNVETAPSTTTAIVDVVHLWDEVVGHYIWYAGLAILIAVCAGVARGRSLDVSNVALAIGGAISGLTWATNGLEGGTAVASLVCAIAALVWAVRTAGGLRVALGAGAVVAVAILGVYGIVNGGFPQPSSL